MGKVRRYFAKDVADKTGLNAQTVRNLADQNLIPSGKDYRGWRVFNEESIKVAKRLAFGELANVAESN